MGNHLICQKTTQLTLMRLTNLSIVLVFVRKNTIFSTKGNFSLLMVSCSGGEVRVKTEIATSRGKTSKISGGKYDASPSTVLYFFYTLPFSFRKQPLFKRKMSLLLF
jgi:hypothetical protein